jgi:hypothetical protein
MPSVVLLDVVPADGLQRNVFLPFLKGFLAASGVPVRWVRFAVPSAARVPGDPGFGPAAEDLGALGDALRSSPPSHVLFALPPDRALLAAVAGAAPAAVLHTLGTEPASVADVPGLPAEGARLSSMLAAPDFGWDPGNGLAAATPPLPYLFVGEECTWRRPLSRNPLYAGLDLAGCTRRDGCAFCRRPAVVPGELPEGEARHAELMRLQVAALAASPLDTRTRLAIRVVGEPFLKGIETFAGILAGASLPPCDVLMDGRADTVLARRASIPRALAALRGTGHVLHLGLVGLESFAAAELARMNKGTTWADNLDVARLLIELERDHGDVFSLRRTDFSVIFFTPWTRPRDLAVNLAVLRRGGIAGLCHKALVSRLRLYPDLPIHALARADGLLADAYDDPLLDTARRAFYPDEVPWRFGEPTMDAACRVLLRMDLSGVTEDDALGREVAALAGGFAGDGDHLEAAEAVLDAAVARPDLNDPAALVAAASGMPRRVDPSRGDAADLSLARLDFEAGLKPVWRVEARDRPPGGWAAFPVPQGYATAERRTGRGDATELFAGPRREDVIEALRLTSVEVDPSRSAADRAEATAALGRLLGYPECCAAAHATRSQDVFDTNAWVHVAARVAMDGEVARELRPVIGLLDHAPCSLSCAASLAQARGRLARLAGRDPGAAGRLAARLDHPLLLFVDADDAAVELLADHEPAGRFRFRAGGVVGSLPLAHRAAEGDEIEIDDHEVLVLRGGRLHAVLSGRAFVWWRRAPVQAAFWSRLVALRTVAIPAMAPRPAPEERPPVAPGWCPCFD